MHAQRLKLLISNDRLMS